MKPCRNTTLQRFIPFSLFVFVLAGVVVGQRVFASAHRMIRLEPPSAAQSWATDINDQGQVVGYYVTQEGRIRSFLWQRGVYTPIDGPRGAIKTWAMGINNQDDIVGYDIANVKDQSSHGFLLHDGQYHPIAGPPWEKSFLAASGINDRGEIVGSYIGRDGQPHGFLLKDGIYSAVEPARGIPCMANGINNAGQVAGVYFTGPHPSAASTSHGFLLQNGAYTPIDKSVSGQTRIARINDKSQVLGTWTSADAHSEASFVLDNGSFTKLHPGADAQETQVLGFNNKGDVVGSYADGKGLNHGFLWR
jgi:probable HAF family extracellular repeat protein